jgi:hypothetical protein
VSLLFTDSRWSLARKEFPTASLAKCVGITLGGQIRSITPDEEEEEEEFFFSRLVIDTHPHV